MNNLPISPSLRHCRDICKGRSFHSDPEMTYSDLRYRLRAANPPFNGERLRRTTLATMLVMVAVLTSFCCLSCI